MSSSSTNTCFVVGALAPVLSTGVTARHVCPCRRSAQYPCRRSAQHVPVCMGRRSDKIKNRKDSQTRARTKVFARIGKIITNAAKAGGPDTTTNKALADALDAARLANFPKETMEKSIARATSKDQADFKESSFEVYGHGGAAIYVNVLTDNPNRAAADIRTVVNKNKMKIGTPGTVAFNFERKGVIRINASDVSDPDELLLAASEAGAEECELDPYNAAHFMVVSSVDDHQSALASIKEAGYPIDLSQLEMVPKNTTTVSEEDMELNFLAIEQLDDLDDVDSVFSNMHPLKEIS